MPIGDLTDTRDEAEKDVAQTFTEVLIFIQAQMVENGRLPENKAPLWTMRSLLFQVGTIIGTAPEHLHEQMMARAQDWLNIGCAAQRAKKKRDGADG